MSGSIPVRWRAVVCFFLVLVLPAAVSAQHDPYEVLFNGSVSENEEVRSPVFTSEELFLLPLTDGSPLFSTLLDNAFLPVRFAREGSPNGFRSVTLLGVELSGNLNTAPDYNLWSALRRSALVQFREADARPPSGNSLMASRTAFGLEPVAVRSRTSVGFFTTDRKGRPGLKASATGTVGKDWTYMAEVYRKWGRDSHIKGVFTDRIAYSGDLSRQIAAHRVTVFSAGDWSEDGLRSYVTAEAADLAGNNFYNPSWGIQNGKVRNSRVAGGMSPITVISYEGPAGRRIGLSASVSYRGGEKRTSGLSWLDADTPYPDYYRYMPSYAPSAAAEKLITDKWRSGDMSVQQVDWTGLYDVNSRNMQTAVFTLADRVERTREFQGFVAAKFDIDKALSVAVSFRGTADNVRRIRRMKDLLGGIAPADIDQYLYEDGIYGDRILNNVREPYRKVNEGDVFGYDYLIAARRAEAYASVDYRLKGFSLRAEAAWTFTAISRKGRFEKEIYPGNLSCGRSAGIRYETMSGELTAGYSPGPKHRLSVTGRIMQSPQPWAVHFITPAYSNAATGVDTPSLTRYLRAGYFFRTRAFSESVSLFGMAFANAAETYSYWDDISSAYTTMLLENVGEKNLGVELAADYDPHPNWNISALVAIGSYKYSTDPQVALYSENTLEGYVSGAVSYLKGYHTARSAERVATTRLKYTKSGITASVAVNYAGDRYVSPSPLRRMQRAFNLASSAEGRAEFLAQEKLGEAFTLDLTFLKSFRIRGNYLSLFLSVSNLADNRGIVYSGYEQLRVARNGSGVTATWKPFANKYLYGYGRSYYCSLTFSF